MARAVRTPITSFIGRRSELVELDRLARAEHLLTLVGPAGIGKTRLAFELAKRAARRGDIVGVAELAALTDPTGLGSAVAGSFGVTGTEIELGRWLRGRSALLVLDNCEHLREGTRDLTARLLAASSELRVLATSREALGVDGERVWRVPPLSLPADDGAWRRSDCVRLFIERASRAAPGSSIDEAAGRSVARLCRTLEGLPLAVELAATRLRSIPLEELAERLTGSLDLLGRDTGSTGRHDTIRNAIAWSHSLLDDRERRVFRRLAVFSGGCAINAAERVCVDADIREDQVLSIVAGLAERSLVEFASGGAGRYRMLEVIRQFALERVRDSGEVDLVEERRARWISELFAAFDPVAAPRPMGPLTRIVAEHANVRGSMEWALANDIGLARQMAGKAWLVYVFLGPGVDPAEIEGWVQRALDADPSPDAARAHMLIGLAQRRFARKDQAGSRRHAEDALALARKAGDQLAVGGAHHRLAISAQAAGDVAGALSHFAFAIEAYGEAGNRAGQAWALAMRGSARGVSGDDEGARTDLASALRISDALPYHRRVRAIIQTIEGEQLARRGEVTEARRSFEETVAIYREIGSEVPIARALYGLADLVGRRGERERAIKMAAAALELAERVGETWPGARPTPAIEKAKRDLGARAERVNDEGRRLTLEQALALAALDPATRPVGRPTLSRREREVARLVAEGLTSREIATRLDVSERTAENHVEHILVKLDLRSRAQIVRWVIENAAGVTGPA